MGKLSFLLAHMEGHTCATQLLNAGCRITSIQRFLGHKKLNTTMIYARANDKNVAEDYYKAMEQVEQQLALPVNHLHKPSSAREMLALADSLSESHLNPAQFEIVSALRAGLANLAGRIQTKMDVKKLMEAC